MRKNFAELSKLELQRNPKSFVLLGDISVGNFMDANDQLPDRVFNMGIAEQAMIGFASGLSTLGGNVIVHTIAAFLVERAFEQIKLCCGYNLNKLILISANGPYDYDKLGPTHHCASDVTLLMTLPNFDIHVPATVDEFKQCYQQALVSNRSTYIRCTSRAAKLDAEPVRINDQWQRVAGRTGSQAVVCIGESLTYALEHCSDSAIYWTTDPRAEIPVEVTEHDKIVVLEPYTGNFIGVPSEVEYKTVRRHFSIEHKKIMSKNMGWEDFEL